MKKKVIAVFVFLLLFCGVFAQEFSAGMYDFGKFELGEFSEYAFCGIGGGFCGEYTLPVNLMFPLGLSSRLECSGTITKSDSCLRNCVDLGARIGIWIRVPISKYFALQPELGYGTLLHFAKIEKEHVYKDQSLEISSALRCSSEDLIQRRTELEVAPFYLVSPENGYAIHELGLRLGAVHKFN